MSKGAGPEPGDVLESGSETLITGVLLWPFAGTEALGVTLAGLSAASGLASLGAGPFSFLPRLEADDVDDDAAVLLTPFSVPGCGDEGRPLPSLDVKTDNKVGAMPVQVQPELTVMMGAIRMSFSKVSYHRAPAMSLNKYSRSDSSMHA